MNNLECIIENYPDEQFLKIDGFDDAILGVETKTLNLVYSKSLIINTLMSRDKMSYDEAIEYYEFNIEGAYLGEDTPIYVDDMFDY